MVISGGSDIYPRKTEDLLALMRPLCIVGGEASIRSRGSPLNLLPQPVGWGGRLLAILSSRLSLLRSVFFSMACPSPLSLDGCVTTPPQPRWGSLRGPNGPARPAGRSPMAVREYCLRLIFALRLA